MIISGFFPSKNGDRRYGHNELNKPLLSLISDGVIPNRGNALQVMSNNDDTIKIMSGVAHCYGHWMENIGVEVITVPQSDYVYDRIDRVVIRCDETEDVRDMYIYIKQGRAQTNPVAPELERTDTIKEMCLADIYVKKQTNQFKQSDITDTRANTDVCGWVVALIDKVDTSTLYLQWKKAYEDYYAKTQADIDGWFANIKENLNGIGVLREYRKKFDITQDTSSFIIDIPMFNSDLDILNVYINGILLSKNEYVVTEISELKRHAVELNFDVSSGQDDIIELVVLRSVDDIDADIIHRFETELMEQKEHSQDAINRAEELQTKAEAQQTQVDMAIANAGTATSAANTAADNANAKAQEANTAAQAATDLVSDITAKLEAGEFKGEKGDTGATGEKGDKGDKGDPGSRTLYGSGSPQVSDGNVGDWYYDTASEFWDVYHKESQDKWTKMGQIKSSFDGNVLIGVIHEYAGLEAPAGYLLCQGQEISRTTYADLFQVIGTTYGSGDGSTTFHIPDMRGRVAVGLHSSDSDFDTMGKQDGSKTHALAVEEMPSHTHTQNAHKHTASGSSGEGGAHVHSASGNSTGAHTHTVSGTAASGGSHAHNTWKVWSTKYAYGTYDIIMTGAPADGRGNPTESAGAHTHTVSGNAASAGGHSHTITVNSGGAHTHTVSVTVNNATAVNQLTGGGLAHNNMQPYIVLNYIIKY